MLGIYHPFTWNRNVADIDTETIYKLPVLDVVLTGDITSIKLVNAETLAEITPTTTSFTYTLRGQTIKCTRVLQTIGLLTGNYFYLNVDDEYYSDLITASDCTLQFTTLNSCSNQYFDWDSFAFALNFYLPDPIDLVPLIETESETIITEFGQKEKTIRIDKKYRKQFVAPVGYIQLLNSLKLNDSVVLETRNIINIEIESEEQEGGRYSLFTLTYQYADELQDGSTCCDIIDIDDIISPDNGGGGEDCTGYSAAISYDGTDLTVVLTSPPVGTALYKWYRNGIYISAATSLTTGQSGDYRVEVTIGNCTAVSNYFIDDECSSMLLELTKTLNTINGSVSNIPDGETVSYSVVLNGVEVATSLPYEALASGIYYVYATAGDCEKVKGVSVVLESDDCDYTLSINQNGNTLESVTTALTPSYQWEIETGDGRSNLGTGSTQLITLKGIYWLTITQGGCSKTVYKYFEPLVTSGVFARYGGTGTAFTVLGINLLNIINYAGEIKVTVNGVVFNYTAGVPLANQYTVNVSGQLVVQNVLTNPSIIIELI